MQLTLYANQLQMGLVVIQHHGQSWRDSATGLPALQNAGVCISFQARTEHALWIPHSSWEEIEKKCFYSFGW